MLRELEEAYAKTTFNKKGDCMVSGLTENIISDTRKGVAMDNLITENANYRDLFNTETWRELDPLTGPVMIKEVITSNSSSTMS